MYYMNVLFGRTFLYTKLLGFYLYLKHFIWQLLHLRFSCFCSVSSSRQQFLLKIFQKVESQTRYFTACQRDCKRPQLSPSSVSLFAKLCARNFTSSTVIYKTIWCRSFIVPPVPYVTVSSSRFTFTYPIRLVMTLFIFYFYNTSGIFNSTFYRQQFLNNLKDIFVSNFYFTFASNFILVFSHHHLATHTYSQRIAFGCQEQTVYRI